MIVATDGSSLFLVRKGDEANEVAWAQLYELSTAALFDQMKPLAVWLKFMYYVDFLNPPVPFTPETADLYVQTYAAAKRARDAASED